MGKIKVVQPPENTYETPIVLDLPMPPSTNRIWRRGKFSTYLNPTYVAWKEKAAEALRRQLPNRRPDPIQGAFEVRLVVAMKKRFKMDLDNRVKATLDWAKEAGLIAEDKFSNRVTIEWGDAPEGVRLTLTPVSV